MCVKRKCCVNILLLIILSTLSKHHAANETVHQDFMMAPLIEDEIQNLTFAEVYVNQPPPEPGIKYQPYVSKKLRKMTLMDKHVIKEEYYENLKKCDKKNKFENAFDELQQRNREKGYLVNMATCDRRLVKNCKNACLQIYERICRLTKCQKQFRREVKKNCNYNCFVEFSRAYGDPVSKYMDYYG